MTQPPVLALWCCPPNKYTYIPSIRNTWEVQIILIKLEIRDSNILRMSDAVSRYGFPQLVGQKHWWITMQKSAFLSQKKRGQRPWDSQGWLRPTALLGSSCSRATAHRGLRGHAPTQQFPVPLPGNTCKNLRVEQRSWSRYPRISTQGNFCSFTR